jgi:hypothetical protein
MTGISQECQMMRTNFARFTLLTLLISLGTLCAATDRSVSSNTKTSSSDVRGVWTGAFQSRNHEVDPFTVTISIEPDAQGNLVGLLTHDSACLDHVTLEVTITGSKVDLAGSDAGGNNITLHGKLDKTATLLDTRYIMNGSATGKCESDGGTGTLAKQ